jgi:hypothetical protein
LAVTFITLLGRRQNVDTEFTALFEKICFAGSLTWAGGTSGSTWLTRNLQLSYRLFAAMSHSLGLNVCRHELPAALGAEGRAFVASALELSIKGSEDVD